MTRPTAPTPIPIPAPPFLHCCEDCVYFLPERDGCAHEYPTRPHRRGALPVVFCKEFELR